MQILQDFSHVSEGVPEVDKRIAEARPHWSMRGAEDRPPTLFIGLYLHGRPGY